MAAQTKVGRDIDSATLPAPGWHGEFPTIKLPKAEVQKGLDYCKLALVGRIDLQLLKFDRVCELVSQKWPTKGEVPDKGKLAKEASTRGEGVDFTQHISKSQRKKLKRKQRQQGTKEHGETSGEHEEVQEVHQPEPQHQSDGEASEDLDH
ncbi:hypothetical protein IFM89_030891 [Coptis chinensis]|uniref:Uncharacterized protein n=1 Tax=Coptis chinensis TaxID=261450 RepID=A0A835HXM8_9MAGN|nr:hypothetical protein IFM89_030891 [Coptis chinensis]